MLVKYKRFIPTSASVTCIYVYFHAKVEINLLDFTTICIVPAVMLTN